MKECLRRFQREERGSAVLEACIVVPLFLFFVLTMYGLITVFMAQNLIGHALLESTQSLALDAYATDQFTQASGEDANTWGDIRNALLDVLGQKAGETDFTSGERWYDRASGATREDWVAAARTRFLAYLGGGETEADAILRALRVTGGKDGLDFSQSDLRGSDLCIRVSYSVEFFFNPFGLAEFSTTQQASARMWGAALTED